MTSKFSPFLIALSCLVMADLNAQSSNIDEIEVVGRRANLAGNASSASEGLVSQAELEIRPILRTGEVLEAVPGMVATQHSGSGKANQFFLRGFNLDHGTDFATFVDKMPVNMRTHGHGQGYTDLNFLIPETVEEIFYQKGSYYANVGDFSGAGASYIRSTDHKGRQRVEVGLGKDSFQRVLAIGDFQIANGDLFYGVEIQGYDGPWEDIEEDVGKKNLWLKQRWQNGDDVFSVSLMAYDNEWNSADQIPQRAIDQGLISDLGSLDTTVGGESSRYSLSGSWSREGQASNVNATAYLIDYSLNLYSNFSYFTDPSGDQFQQVDDRKIFGWDIDYSLDSKWAGISVTNTFGTQFRYDKIDEVGLLNTQARQEIGVSRVDAVDEWSSSLYWQNELHFSERLRSTFGLRYDNFDFDVDPLRAGDTTTLSVNGGSRDDDIVTATLGLSYTINDNVEAYASIGEGFHSNDARGTTIQVDPTDANQALDTVDPLVSTLGYELGLRAFVSDKLNASIALWNLQVDSELIFVGDEGGTEDTGESSTRRGLELTAYYYLNDIFTFDFEYAYTDAKYDRAVDGSRDISGALKNVASAGVNADLGDKLNINLRFRHFGEYPLDGGQVADASTLANLRLGYKASEAWSITLDVLNLFDSDDHDVEYFYESQLATELSPVGDSHFHVFEPRTVRAYVKYQF